MSLASKLKNFNRIEIASIVFYAATGIIFLVYLPLTSFAPELGLLGILSLIATYCLFTKRSWTQWLLIVILVGGLTFSIYTLYSIGFSNALIAISMIVYAVLVTLVTFYMLLKKKT